MPDDIACDRLIANLFLDEAPRIARATSHKYAPLSLAQAEELVWEAYPELLKRRAHFRDIFISQGNTAIIRLLYCITYRKACQWFRKKSTQCEHLVEQEELLQKSYTIGDQGVIELLDTLQCLIDEITEQKEPLRSALEERILTNNTDTAVAKRHGIQRTSLCRARLRVERRLLAQA